ncbi:LemA family protein [Ostertagia ostertagi]
MTGKKLPVLVIAAILVVAGIYLATAYNTLVRKEEKIKLQWNEIQNVYQRRLDLVPSLVNTVKGLADFEQTTLENIAEARSRAAQVSVSSTNPSAATYQQQQAAQDNLASATNRLLISVEKYPALKGTAAFAGLQTQLEGTERRIKVARKDFNAAVADYNNSVRSFPSSIAARLFSFKTKEGFEAVVNADKAIEIKFN